MKKLIIILLCSVFFMSANSQVTIGIGAGYAPKQELPTAEISVGAIFREALLIDLSMQSMISRKQSAATQFQWRMGGQLNRNGGIIFIPYAGMSFHYTSADNHALNRAKPLFGLELGKPFEYESGRIYFNTSVSGKTTIVSVGIRYLFSNNKDCY